jgi:hypothetical protein
METYKRPTGAAWDVGGKPVGIDPLRVPSVYFSTLFCVLGGGWSSVDGALR